MTEGVIEYIDGEDKSEAVRKIKKGAAENAPDQVREFAGALRALSAVPGAAQYMGPVLEVASLLAPDAAEPKAGAPSKTKAHARSPVESDDDPPSAKTAAPDDARPTIAVPSPPPAPLPIAGTTVPSVDEGAGACAPFGETGMDIGNAVGRCATVSVGPMVVTDVLTPGGCTNDLIVGAGAPGHPRWAVTSLASTPALNVHGASLPVSAGESLFVAQVGSTAAAIRRDVRCSITWAALRR